MNESNRETDTQTAPKQSPDDERMMRDVRPVNEPRFPAVRTGVKAGRSGDVRGNNNSDHRLKRSVRRLRGA